MSRQSRIEEYRRPDKAVSGFSSKKEDLAYWAKRASDNSQNATRAKSGDVKLPDNGGQPKVHSTSAGPHGHGIDPYDKASRNVNSAGSSYMRHVRRTVGGS
ncbi:hypothetical protein [Bradyrhizobium sp. SZCCHNR1098]|uniref:hypothetical protein n=1 Tax=Bradyrhizobium sp. SZCCHNR1098 TaxID=3057370 RepID=UPI002915E1B1|nr:hypothetical protein [Bradyrhizobium sp. SZCCHNR1098]